MDNVKYLLPQVKKYFKTNLHTHSTVSDGRFTPAQVKERYKASGYSILSLTDHNIVVDHSDLNDPDFLMLTGSEFNVNESKEDLPLHRSKTYHLNFIAKKPDTLWQPFGVKYRDDVQPYAEKAEIENMPREYTVDAINAIIARANEKGHLVMYNHPVWSLQDYHDYAPLKGLWGMELCNYSSLIAGFDDYHNWVVYRDMMNTGNPLFPVGADDAHATTDACGGWIMVGAEKLEYDSVITALEKGDFYASTGPEIHSLTLDGSVLRVTCTDARHITLESGDRYGRCAMPIHNDGLLREAAFDISDWLASRNDDPTAWLRLVVHGPYGHYAATRGYTWSELK